MEQLLCQLGEPLRLLKHSLLLIVAASVRLECVKEVDVKESLDGVAIGLKSKEDKQINRLCKNLIGNKLMVLTLA